MKNFLTTILAIFMLSCTFASAQTSNANNDNNLNINTGNALSTNNGNAQSITFQGAAQQQQAPMPVPIVVPNHGAPSVFQYVVNNLGMPVELTGLALEILYEEKCQPEESEKGRSRVLEKKGDSNLTRLTITTHPSYESMRRGDKVAKTRMDISGGKKRYRCLGIVSAVADKDALEKGQPVGYSAVVADMRRAVREEFVGVPGGVTGNIVLLSGSNYFSGAVGVASQSSGASLGASVVNVLGRLATGAIAPGIAGGSGISSPAARFGFTALILTPVEDNDPDGVEISIREVRDPGGVERSAASTPDGNGVKAEAEKR